MRPPARRSLGDNPVRSPAAFLHPEVSDPPASQFQTSAPRLQWGARYRQAAGVEAEGASCEYALDGLRHGLGRGGFIPIELGAHHIEERAAIHVLPLQPAGEDVRRSQVTARGYIPGIGDQIVVSPAAAIEPFSVPSNSRAECFIQAAERKQRAV